MTVLAFLMVGLGVASTALHLATARPRNPLSAASLNANGWVLIALVLYLRSLAHLMLASGGHYAGPVTFDAVFGLVSGYVIDALIIYRMVSYRRYRVAYRQRQAEADAEAR